MKHETDPDPFDVDATEHNRRIREQEAYQKRIQQPQLLREWLRSVVVASAFDKVQLHYVGISTLIWIQRITL